MRAVLLAVIASAAVGCVGGIDMPTPTPQDPVGPGTNPSPVPPAQSQARQMFENNVFPIIKADQAATKSGCAGTGACHSTAGATPVQFVAADLADAYATATSYQSVVGNFTSATAGILTQVANGHQGRMYTDAEKKSITDWLAQEVVERAGVNPGPGSGSGSSETPGQATARLLNGWTACMTEANWTTANMTTAWGNMQANNGSKCESCHATGGQGMIASEIQDSGPSGVGMWTVVSTNEYYLVQFFTVDLTATPAKVVINHVSFDGVSKGQAPHTEHPQFDSTNNNGMTALSKFYDLTAAAVTAGNCGPTKLNPPAQ